MKHRSHPAVGLLFPVLLLAFLGGCYGGRSVKEQQARQDFGAAASRYRSQTEGSTQKVHPEGQRPVESPRPILPPLNATSSLADLIQYAVLNNASVEAAFYDWKAAVEAITTARSLPDPMLTFGAEISRGMTALAAALMTDPAAGWPGPGKLTLRADAAYGEALKRRAVFEGELLAAALAVKRAYYQLWTLDEQSRWTRDALGVVDEMEKLARERLAVGGVTQQDVLRAQMERDRLQTELASLEDARGPIIARLRSALGLGPDAAFPVLAVRLEPTPSDFSEPSLLAAAFERNPQLKERRSEVLQAISLFHLARKNNVPDFSLGFGAKKPPTMWMPSIGVRLPLWRSRIAAEIAQANAGVGAAQARLSAEELDLAVRFAETAFAWREADRNARLYGAMLLPKAKAALESARAGYTAGTSGFLDLLEAERSLLDYHVNDSMAVGEREIVLAEMSLVILGRWPEDVQTILPAENPPAAPQADLPATKETAHE